MTSKRCFKCLCEKPLEAFYTHKRMADGRLNKCKDCTKADATKHRIENIEHVRQYDRMRGSMPHRVAARKEYQKTQAFAESHEAAVKRWQAKHPERRAAQTAVGNALRSGLLQKQPCWACGDEAEAHHPDYSRLLDVVWLCNPHHREVHAMVA